MFYSIICLTLLFKNIIVIDMFLFSRMQDERIKKKNARRRCIRGLTHSLYSDYFHNICENPPTVLHDSERV